MNDIPCPFCSELIKPAAIKCPHCKMFLKEDPSRIARDLKTEAHFLALGFWFRIFSVLGVIGGLLMGAATALSGPKGKMETGVVLALCGLVVVLSVVGFFVAQGLTRFQNWARITMGVLCVISVIFSVLAVVMAITNVKGEAGNAFGQLISIVLYGSIATTLLGSRGGNICTDRYREGMMATPDQRASMTSSAFFWVYTILIGIVLLAVVAGVVLGVAAATR